MTRTILAIGWTRDRHGKTKRFHLHPYTNTITQFAQGGCYVSKDTGMANTSPHVLIEYEP